MDITTLIPDALQWSEGMLLSPQHFQQNDIYWHQQLWHRGASLQPHYWGVLDLAFSAGELINGVLKIERLHAIFPDGLAVQRDQRQSDIAPLLDLKSSKIVWNEQQILKIHLCVPIRSEGSASSNSDIRRFDSLLGQAELDENTNDGRVAVGRLRPRLELLPENQLSAKHIAFPIAEIQRKSATSFVLTDYHPPMLYSRASTFLDGKGLQEQLGQLTKKMRDKAKELIGDRHQDDDENQVAASQEEKQQLFAARMLTAGLPAFELQLGTWTSHPFDLYLGLGHLVGQAAGIGADPMPPVLPPYQHEDAMPGFKEGIAFIQQRLDRLRLDFESLPFDRISSSAFIRHLPEDLLADTLIVELKPSAGQTNEQIAQWLGQARIASDDLMPTLAERRLPGATFRAVDHSQLSGLQLRPDAQVFEIVNKAIELENRLLPLIRRGGLLKIQGASELPVPAGILLHRTRIKGARGSRKGEAAAGDGATVASTSAAAPLADPVLEPTLGPFAPLAGQLPADEHPAAILADGEALSVPEEKSDV